MSLSRPPSLPVLVLPDLGEETIDPFEPKPKIPPQCARRSSRRPSHDKEPDAPQHPITIMQSPFEESFAEATYEGASDRPKLRVGDAKYRRELIVNQAEGSRKLESKYILWRKRPGQRYHELWRLISQISFGVYLLLTGQANDDHQVVGILQGHIDDVDEFLEVIMEDLDYAIEDIFDRHKLLQLPMENIGVFETMLEDRNFRYQIVSGNEKIERILAVSRRVLVETEKDVAEGLDASREFHIYLSKQHYGNWRTERSQVAEIYEAMNANTDGWMTALLELQSKTKKLDLLITKLAQLVAEIDRKAGEVSRRTRFSINPYSSPGSDSQSGESTPRASMISAQVTSPQGPGPRSPARLSVNRWPRDLRVSARSSTRDSRETLSAYDFKLPPVGVPGTVNELAENENETIHDGLVDKRQSTLRPTKTDAAEEPIYILQPRTYTPVPPEPLPAPLKARDEPVEADRNRDNIRGEESHRKRSSLRDRVSLKVQPPVSIQIPPPNVLDFQPPIRPSPKLAVTYPAPDSAYGSDVERRPTIHSFAGDISISDFSPPSLHPGLMPSPRSDHQRYIPVQASPHSPLQQRPWTAGDQTMLPPRAQSSQSHHTRQAHVRNKPSQMNMSTLSSVTSASDLRSEGANSTDTRKQLKKKRSAFGWFKKAFSLDDEERAQFEKRRQQQQVPSPYTAEPSPRFLDGKRIR